MNTLPINTIINGECVSEMKKLPNSCIDIIIADPPYNLSKGGEWKWDNSVELQGMGGNWNKVMLIPVVTTYNSLNVLTRVRNDLSLGSTRLVGGDTKDIKISVVYSRFMNNSHK